MMICHSRVIDGWFSLDHLSSSSSIPSTLALLVILLTSYWLHFIGYCPRSSLSIVNAEAFTPSWPWQLRCSAGPVIPRVPTALGLMGYRYTANDPCRSAAFSPNQIAKLFSLLHGPHSDLLGYSCGQGDPRTANKTILFPWHLRARDRSGCWGSQYMSCA